MLNWWFPLSINEKLPHKKICAVYGDPKELRGSGSRRSSELEIVALINALPHFIWASTLITKESINLMERCTQINPKSQKSK